ncbi:MAG: hypothetical protein IH898_06250 [Planctomycetes bacterium]|nr:hypothetical protein [Planctomycetota bacterium]
MKKIFWGLVWVVFVSSLIHYWIGNPIHELALIRSAEVAQGTLIESFQEHDAAYKDRGRLDVWKVGVYSFRVPDGRKFNVVDEAAIGQLKQERTIEYLPDNPNVNRFQGEGSQSIMSWLFGKVILGTLLLVLIVSPGLVVLRERIKRSQERIEVGSE